MMPMAPQKDPYQILHVSPAAGQQTIRDAYRDLARRYHPDVNPSPDAAVHMQDLNWAYDLLIDPARRSAYDSGLDPDVSVFSYYRTDSNPITYEEPSRRSRIFYNVGRVFLLIVLLAGWVLSPILSEGRAGFNQISKLFSNPAPNPGSSSAAGSGFSLANCKSWPEISLTDLDTQICVWGTILSNTSNGSWSMLRLSGQPADNLILVDRSLSSELNQGECLLVRGQVEHQDHRLMILVRSADQLLPCD